jgi:hypothetical protein
MEHQFDQLAKALAEGMSRREVLSRLRGVLAGGVLALLGMKAASADRVCPAGQHLSTCHFLGLVHTRDKCCPNGTHCGFDLFPTLHTICQQGHG